MNVLCYKIPCCSLTYEFVSGKISVPSPKHQNMEHLLQPIAAHLNTHIESLTLEPIHHGTRQKHNVCRLRHGTRSYLLKQHDITTPVRKTGYTPCEIESAILSILHRSGCRVPKILWKSESRHVLLLEWCGELTLDAAAQCRPLPELKPLLHATLATLCHIETAFTRNAELLAPYIFHFNHHAALQGALQRGRQTLGYLTRDLPASQTRHLDNVWAALSNRLRTAPPTLDSLDYQSRNIVISDETPFFIDFSSVGWDWQERRFVQYFNSIGANREDAHFVSLLDHDLVATYAEWVSTHRETLSPTEITARVDSHHLLFYLSVIHQLLRAVAQPETAESTILRTAWGDLKTRYRDALRQLGHTTLSPDTSTNQIREMIAEFN